MNKLLKLRLLFQISSDHQEGHKFPISHILQRSRLKLELKLNKRSAGFRNNIRETRSSPAQCLPAPLFSVRISLNVFFLTRPWGTRQGRKTSVPASRSLCPSPVHRRSGCVSPPLTHAPTLMSDNRPASPCVRSTLQDAGNIMAKPQGMCLSHHYALLLRIELSERNRVR